MNISPEELRLLRSYVTGPKIWDAASLYPLVLKLEARGLISSPDAWLYALTDSGKVFIESPDRVARAS